MPAADVIEPEAFAFVGVDDPFALLDCDAEVLGLARARFGLAVVLFRVAEVDLGVA
ncbi:MAG TPA: hypothetical protein VHR72_02270 [Gemmataceae bacterium]|nr:hypothetical protein [Gemmataceae bacterium]